MHKQAHQSILFQSAAQPEHFGNILLPVVLHSCVSLLAGGIKFMLT